MTVRYGMAICVPLPNTVVGDPWLCLGSIIALLSRGTNARNTLV